VTTLTPDLLAHVASVRDGACDDNELLVLADHLAEADDEDRAELVRVQVALERRPGNWPEARAEVRQRLLLGQISNDAAAIMLAVADSVQDSLQRRERDLLARNPAWLSVKCPECGGSGDSRKVRLSHSFERCPTCGGEGDYLNPFYGWVDDKHFARESRATITRGFLDITLPHTLCWRLEEMPSTQCTACRGRGARAWHAGVSGQGCGECGNHDTIDLWRPHPVLRAVLASPAGPWVRRVWVEGREPFVDHNRKSAGWQERSVGMRVWRGNPPSEREPYLIPDPVFDLLGGKLGAGNSRRFPTAEAATDALARAVPLWARGAK